MPRTVTAVAQHGATGGTDSRGGQAAVPSEAGSGPEAQAGIEIDRTSAEFLDWPRQRAMLQYDLNRYV